jgi:biotin carboxylase
VAAADAPDSVTPPSTVTHVPAQPASLNGGLRSRILVIAPHGSYRTAPFLHAVSRLGHRALIASEGKHSIVGAYANGLHIDLSDTDAALKVILREAAHQPFSAVIGTDDSTTELATLAAEKLGLPHNPLAAVRLARRKDLARARLAQSGIPVPAHRKLDLRRDLDTQIRGFGFPAVVKPVALSASRGVIRVNDATELRQAAVRIKNLLHAESGLTDSEKNSLLLETFVAGTEVAVEAMLYAGQLNILAIFDKPDPLDGPYFEETYYITPTRLNRDTVTALHAVLAAACESYGLREGPVHAECRINSAGVWVIEIAARTIGGLCGRLLRFGTGCSLEELVLFHATGQHVPANASSDASGVLMIPIPAAGVLKRVEGLLQAQKVPYIEEVNIQIREGHEVVPLPDGASYLGFIFARAPDTGLAESALRAAHACLNIVIAPLWKLQSSNVSGSAA